jgi:NAD(P)-dependent dehydrogenase (short-subunit alcohol dehydrogenase family)
MKDELTGKIALVTGGSRGIGRAAAVALAKAGADVAVNFQHREAAARAVCREIEGIGRRALAVRTDVSKAAEVARLVETVEKGLGSIDILVNNAGISRPQPLGEITEMDWDDVLTVNLKSMFLVTQAVLPGNALRSARTSRTLTSRDWLALFRPASMLMARTPPLTAPQMPPVFAIPPHSPVAILGINSDWMPRLSATACKTLSAQQNPCCNNSSLRWAT